MGYKKISIISLITLFLISCGSKKNVTRSSSKKLERIQIVINQEKNELKKIRPLYKKGLNKYTVAYIQDFAPLAVIEMKKYKIPASITIAQGILESRSGRSELSLKSNNHFGIKCHKSWNGKRVYHDDDKRHECFRKYAHPIDSFKDHSLFLSTRDRYSFLFNYKITNYKAWAYGLRKAGYATDRHYPKKLIALINDYQLYRYDRFSKKRNRVKQIENKEPNKQTYKVVKGDTLFSIAKSNKISVEELKQLNELNSNNLSIGQILKLN